ALNGLLSFFDEPQEVVQGTDYLKQRLIAQAARLSFLQGQFQQGEELLVRLPENDPERILAEVQGALLAGATTAARLLVGRLVSGELTLRQQRDYLLACAVVAWQLDENEIAFEHLRLVAPIGSRVEALEALSMLPYPELHGLASAAAGAGEAWLAEVLAELPEELRAQRFELLSKAELRALRALQGAASLEQIAATLFISLNTLKYHLRNVYRKLNVSGRDGAVRRATAMGLFEEPDEVAVA
ncbi:TPA: LuxR C-terminal-related transcriptional regulator, partial [Streptococcus pneumoniae]